MNILGFRPKADIWTGVALGVAILAAPVVIPIVAAAVRPILKAGLKGGFIVYEKGREALANVKEMAEDLTEEVKAELKTDTAQVE